MDQEWTVQMFLVVFGLVCAVMISSGMAIGSLIGGWHSETHPERPMAEQLSTWLIKTAFWTVVTVMLFGLTVAITPPISST